MLQTWDYVGKHFTYYPVKEFQKRIVLSATPPPDANNPCWCGDHAKALTADLCFVKIAQGFAD